MVRNKASIDKSYLFCYSTYMKTCRRCKEEYENKSPRQWYCEPCAVEVPKENSRRANANHRRKLGRQVGVGSGGTQLKGEESPYWKTGIGTYKKKGRKKLEQLGFKCERCDCDIDQDKKGSWATHHKDHNRQNNKDENLEVLCKRCHQVEHECWKALSVKV